MSVVLIGGFNPMIFQPAWLAAQKLIRQDEADAAMVEIIHPNLTRFSADWLQVEVAQSRFTAGTSDPACFAPLRDFVVGVFTALEHTPFQQMGINHQMHFKLSSVERWHAVGHLLVPKGPWEGLLENPGMRTMTITGKRAGSAHTSTFVTVEPSLRIQQGVFLNVNDHFERPPSLDSARQLLELLRSSWDDSLAQGSRTAKHLLAQVKDS